MSGLGLAEQQPPPGAVLSALVTELLRIVHIATTSVDDAETEPPVVEADGAERATMVKMDGARARFTAHEAGGVDPVLQARLDAAAKLYGGARSINTRPDLPVQLNSLGLAFKDLVAAHAPVKAEIAARDTLRAQLAARLPQLVPDTDAVPQATLPEAATLLALRVGAAQAVTGAATLADLRLLPPRIDAVAAAKRDLVETVRARLELKQRIEADAAAVTQPDNAAATSLKAERDVVVSALATAPPDDKSLADAGLALAKLVAARETLEKRLAALRPQRALARAELAAATDAFNGIGVKGNRKSIDISMADCAKCIADPLDKIRLNGFDDCFAGMRSAIASFIKSNNSPDKASGLYAYVRSEQGRLQDEAVAVPDLNRDDLKTLKTTAANQVAGIFTGLAAATGGNLTKAVNRLTELNDTVTALRAMAGAEARALAQAKLAIEADIAPDLAGYAAGFAGKLLALRTEALRLLAGGLLQNLIDGARAQADAFVAMLVPAAADAAAEKAVRSAQAVMATDFDPALAAARPPVKAELQRARVAAEAVAALAGDARDMVGAARLFAALLARMNESGAEAKVPGAALFTGVTVGNLPVGDKLGGEVFALCGPHLLGKLNTAATSALCAAMQAQGPAITGLLMDGLGGDAQVFAALVERSGAEGLVELAKAFGGADAATARVALGALMEKGGLAEHPEALAEMLRDGVAQLPPGQQAARRAANAAAMKGTVDAFSDPGGPAALNGLMNGCALGASASPPAPPPVASLLHGGCGGDGLKMRAFADAFAGQDAQGEADRAGLKGLVQGGGIAQHPSSFGPLVAKGGAAAVKSIGAAFTVPADRARLKTLLDSGGMAGDPPDAHPDTLAKVCVDGLEGSGEKLRQYAAAFAGHADQSKMMLDAWNETPDTPADKRQPGQAIGKLLGADKLNGDIAALQSKFAATMGAIGDVSQRKQAVRFAPHFDKQPVAEGWKPQSGAMAAAGVTNVTSSVLKRHQPETFSAGSMHGAALHSQFPPGTDVGALIDGAVAQLGLAVAGVNRNKKLNVGGLLVEIAVAGNGELRHFTPHVKVHGDAAALQDSPAPPDPNAPAQFTTATINSILASIT